MRLALHWQVFIAMAAGIAFAVVAGEQALVAAPLGEVFMRLLRMVIVPLVFTSIVSGVISVGDARGVGRLGVRTLLYYTGTSTLAILVGLGVTNLIQPGVGVARDLAPSQEMSAADLETPTGVTALLTRLIPANPVQAAAEGDILGIIFFSIVLGVAILQLPARPRGRLQDLFSAGFDAMMALTRGVILLLPIGVFGLICDAVATMGLDVFAQVGRYLVTVAVGLLIHWGVVLPALYWALLRRSPLPHWRAMASAMLTAFSTSSSSATLPVTMQSLREGAGVSPRVTSFVVPMGATINMDGTALYECAGALFIAQALGVELGLGQQLLVVLTALLASIGAAAIPSAGLVMIFVVLEAIGLDTPEAHALVGILFGIDRPLDMARTAVNVTSDSVGTAVIAWAEGETLRYATGETRPEGSDPGAEAGGDDAPGAPGG